MLLAEYITSQNSQEAIGVATGEELSNLNAAASDKIASAPALAALAQQSAYADLQRVGNAYWDPRLQPWGRRWQKAIIQMCSHFWMKL